MHFARDSTFFWKSKFWCCTKGWTRSKEEKKTTNTLRRNVCDLRHKAPCTDVKKASCFANPFFFLYIVLFFLFFTFYLYLLFFLIFSTHAHTQRQWWILCKLQAHSWVLGVRRVITMIYISRSFPQSRSLPISFSRQATRIWTSRKCSSN